MGPLSITESALMRHAERAEKLLAQVKDMGAQIVVDDFGSRERRFGQTSAQLRGALNGLDKNQTEKVA